MKTKNKYETNIELFLRLFTKVKKNRIHASSFRVVKGNNNFCSLKGPKIKMTIEAASLFLKTLE